MDADGSGAIDADELGAAFKVGDTSWHGSCCRDNKAWVKFSEMAAAAGTKRLVFAGTYCWADSVVQSFSCSQQQSCTVVEGATCMHLPQLPNSADMAAAAGTKRRVHGMEDETYSRAKAVMQS
jgi:hypothetical protein